MAVTLSHVMAMHAQILKLIVTALFVVPLFLAPAKAQTSETDLLQQLQTAPESDANRLERELALIWDQSGSAAMDLLLKRGREALEAEDNARAVEHLSALTDHAPEFAEGWHARATALYRTGLYGPALDALHKALLLNPNNFNAIFGLGVMLREFGDLERSATAFDRVLELNPHHERAKAAKEQLAVQGLGQTL
ncbi:tetratricopeptide repeat protein [Roseobacter litoralis]|uniref:tetratricopeptide repeat protein n=1 Tax=Roseobacter litoralis TaxID=42443 RepID=UPI002493DA39|nr:tetratricopeptide repeat protein [Roseobacter litoralis]